MSLGRLTLRSWLLNVPCVLLVLPQRVVASCYRAQSSFSWFVLVHDVSLVLSKDKDREFQFCTWTHPFPASLRKHGSWSQTQRSPRPQDVLRGSSGSLKTHF